uniref:SH3 domain-containing protein n=2 Tax=Wuchereria bancrofti TaxID=6293 RepID=A0AAF5Q610_WUCBA
MRKLHYLRVQATCVTHRDSISSDSSDSIIAFPVEVDRDEISEQETDPNSDSEKDIMHGDSTIFSIENTALDTRMTLKSVLNCPFEYINKQPPLLAMENYCFVINGDLVNVEQIIENSKSWWKQTSSRVRYYLSKGMKTFYEVDALLCRGELRCAYARRGRAASIEPIPLEQIFRVSRIYSHWKTCISFHRIISCISPVTKNATEVYGFQKRIFVQYLWRTEKREEKRRVAREYRRSKIPVPSTQRTTTDRLRKLSLIATFDKSSSLMQNSIGTMISGHNYPSYISHPEVNYQPKQTLQTDLSTSFNRRHSLIPQLQNSRRRSEQQRINETFKITLPKSTDNKNRPTSLLEFREQFQKHQKKFRKREFTSTINC